MERGRRRSFDKDEALEKALLVFWRNGYQGASLSELTEAMGINKPSLYATYGNKESLYLQALQLYATHQTSKHQQVLESKEEPQEAVHAFLESVLEMQNSPDLPCGCFVVNGTTGCSSSGMPEVVDKALRQAVEGSISALEDRFQRDIAAGRLDSAANPKSIALYVGTLVVGLAVLAKAGTPRDALRAVIDQSVEAIPTTRAV